VGIIILRQFQNHFIFIRVPLVPSRGFLFYFEILPVIDTLGVRSTTC
jgi:hypothetical protein